MNISEVDDKVKMTDFENFLNVVKDSKRNLYKFNLNSGIYLDVPKKIYDVYHDSFWTTLSYEIYKTTRLWWLLMKVNNIKVENTFDIIPASSQIYYVDEDIVRQILLEMKG